MNPAAALLARLAGALQPLRGVARAKGVTLLRAGQPLAAAGWDGQSWAAPAALARRVMASDRLRAAPLVLSNDPYAGGTRLGQLFLLTRGEHRQICAALDLAEFGAMPADVFCRQREVFHEGLRLSLLAVTPGSRDWTALTRLVAANVRQADAVLAAIAAAWTVLDGAASASLQPVQPPIDPPVPPEPAALPVVQGRLAADRRTLRLSCASAAAACSPSTVASAALLGVADAFRLPPWTLEMEVQAEAGPLVPLPPAAVGGGVALAAACWQAGYAAVGGTGQGAWGRMFAPLAAWCRT